MKPSNVLIADDGRVVLTDFGIAQVEGDPSITSTGMLVGAPSYISPERARGHKPGPAADLWSLGGLLYAAVEGSPPYDKGSAIATLTAVMTEPVDPPKNAGPELEQVIYGLLAKDPAQRLDDARARVLLRAVLDAPVAAPEVSPEVTRAILLPPRPDRAPVDPAADRDRTPDTAVAADRVRGALKSVRNAAASAKAEPKAKPPRPRAAEPLQGGGRQAPARAPLTDVVPRRTLVIIAAVAVLALLGTILTVSSPVATTRTSRARGPAARRPRPARPAAAPTGPAAPRAPAARGRRPAAPASRAARSPGAPAPTDRRATRARRGRPPGRRPERRSGRRPGRPPGRRPGRAAPSRPASPAAAPARSCPPGTPSSPTSGSTSPWRCPAPTSPARYRDTPSA